MLTFTPSVILSARKKETSFSLQTNITRGYRLKAVEKYKRIATYVEIFPVLGRSER